MPCCRGLPASGPDSSRSWLVAVACSWNLLWSSLVRRSSGVIYVALVDTFGVNREQTSWTLSVSISLAWLLGPVIGALTKCVPLMALSIAGTAVCSVSAIGCVFAGDMTAVFLLLGICAGIGNGIVMPTSDVIIGRNFRLYRGSGSGIYYTGGTLASFAFPPILHLLLKEYGFRGAFLITGGLMLNGLAACVFFGTPPWATSAAGHAKASPQGTNASEEVPVATINDAYKASIEPSSSPNKGLNGVNHKETKAEFKSTVNSVTITESSGCHDGTCPSESADAAVVLRGDSPTENGSTTTVDIARAAVKYEFPPSSLPKQTRGPRSHLLKKLKHGPGDVPEGIEVISMRQLHNDLNGKGDCSRGQFDECLERQMEVTLNGRATAVEEATTSRRESEPETMSAPPDSQGHWTFLRSPVFYMVAVTCVSSVYSFLILMILVDFAEEKGFTKRDGAVLLSLTAIGDASARLISGFLSDRKFCDRRTLLGGSALLSGALCATLPSMHAGDYALAATLCVLFGWCNGSVVVLFGPVLADHVGVANLGLSGGIIRFVMGLVYLACPKITGYFKDEVGSYNGLFYLISIGSFLVGLMWTVELIHRTLRKRKTNAGH
ncbi:uncharacterized protein LOC144145722 [Haemaphysalis longicornis]